MISKELLLPFQHQFDSEVIDNIANVAFLKTFQKHDIIIDIGQDLNFIPLLIHGNIKVLREDSNENELLLYVLESGDTCAMSLTDEMLETIDTLAFMKMDERLFKYLTDTVKLSASTVLEITHQEIAEDLHTSRVVISRLLKQLEKEHKIELGRNKITVLDF